MQQGLGRLKIAEAQAAGRGRQHGQKRPERF